MNKGTSKCESIDFILTEMTTNQTHLRASFDNFQTIAHQVWQFHFDNISVIVLHTHLIRPCGGASGVVGRYPCYSRTYNVGASSHLIPRPDLVLDTSWGYYNNILFGGLVAQAVRRSPPTAGVPSSRLGHSMWVSWWTKRGLCRFSRGFSRFPLPQISFHHFSTLISSISVSFIRPCDGASGVVGRYPCYSRTYNIGASSHLIPRPDLVLDTSWGYLFSFI